MAPSYLPCPPHLTSAASAACAPMALPCPCWGARRVWPWAGGCGGAAQQQGPWHLLGAGWQQQCGCGVGRGSVGFPCSAAMSKLIALLCHVVSCCWGLGVWGGGAAALQVVASLSQCANHHLPRPGAPGGANVSRRWAASIPGWPCFAPGWLAVLPSRCAARRSNHRSAPLQCAASCLRLLGVAHPWRFVCRGPRLLVSPAAAGVCGGLLAHAHLARRGAGVAGSPPCPLFGSAYSRGCDWQLPLSRRPVLCGACVSCVVWLRCAAPRRAASPGCGGGWRSQTQLQHHLRPGCSAKEGGGGQLGDCLLVQAGGLSWVVAGSMGLFLL